MSTWAEVLQKIDFFYKRVGFFVKQIVIISVTKIWRHANFSVVYQTRK